jgi:hypothetical protein
MKGQAGRGRLIATVTLSLLLAGCSQPVTHIVRPITAATTSAPARISGSQPTSYLRPGAWRIGSVHAILTSAFPSNHVPPFDRISVSAAAAQRLYHALLSLPAAPANIGSYYCPADWGTRYYVFFYDYSDSSRLVALATINPGGCNLVTLPDGSQRWTAVSPDFWNTFAAALNVSLATVENRQPQATGPTAPTSLPTSLFSGA